MLWEDAITDELSSGFRYLRHGEFFFSFFFSCFFFSFFFNIEAWIILTFLVYYFYFFHFTFFIIYLNNYNLFKLRFLIN